ncbi:MAG: RNA methyltransferase [Anaerolineae bacterium]|jgi:TrmH family RNA methyltransferase|nr:RNA methyltransferase [Anaerolineae bacterium]
MPELISSLQNPRVKLTRRLRDKRDREREGRFVIDSVRDLRRALDCGLTPDFVLVCPQDLREDLPDLPPGVVIHTTPEVMDKVGYRDNPEGVVAVMHAPPVYRAGALDNVPDAPILGLVALEKPGNLGALMRTADAAGFRSVFLIDCALDLYNPNIIRSSTGAVFLGNVYTLSGAEARMFFKRRGFRVVGTHLQAAQDAYALTYPTKTALLMGAEDTGLPDSWLPACDAQVLIPMVGRLADSLNVSVAGAVLMYEVLRQTRSSE